MKNEPYPDVDTLCRLCLKEHKNSFSIFVEDESQLSIPMRIMACVSLEVKTSDGLPKKICAECRYQLEKSFLFRRRSQAADKKMRKHLRIISMGKKSRIFEKSQDDNSSDYDEDELEFEESVAFITNQDNLREKHDEEWRENYKKEMSEKFNNQLEVAKVEWEAELTESVSKKLRNELRDDVRKELRPEMEKQCRKEQITKLVSELEIYLAEKKADLWMTVEDSPPDGSQSSVEAEEEPAKEIQTVKRPRSASPKAEPTYKQLKIEPKSIKTIGQDFEVIRPEELACTESGEIYIINNVGNECEGPTYSTDIQVESLGKNTTSYNIKNNGEITFAGSKSSSQEDHVVLLDFNSELGEDMQLSDFDQDVIILPKVKTNNETQLSSSKQRATEIVVKTIAKTNLNAQNHTKAGRPSDTLKTFRCELCPIKFATQNSLTRHMNIHEKTQKKGDIYKCSVCELQVSCASSLKRHMVIHTGIKPHKCEECGQAFVQREVLKRHMLTHTGERRYQCHHCSKRFAQKINLKQHVAKVHMNSPHMHECHVCQRRFSHVSGLSRHLATHAGIVYQCKECGRQFVDRSAVKRHVRTVHNVKESTTDDEISEIEMTTN